MKFEYTNFEQSTKPWPGCGFVKKTTYVKVRRVKDETRDEAQIELHIAEVRGTRLHSHTSTIVLSPADALRFVEALAGISEQKISAMAGVNMGARSVDERE